MATQAQGAVDKWEDVPAADEGWTDAPAAANASAWEDVPNMVSGDTQRQRDIEAARVKQGEIAANPDDEAAIARDLANTPADIQVAAQGGTPAVKYAAADPNAIRLAPIEVKPKRSVVKRPTFATRPAAAAAPEGPGMWERLLKGGEAQPPLQPPPSELTDTDTLPGFVFSDFLPGAVESQVGGLYNMGVQGLTAWPALAGAALAGSKDGSSYIDRFKELHGSMSEPLTYKMQTATGEHVEKFMGDKIEWVLDKAGQLSSDQFGPEVGAYTKGALAALAAAAGVTALKGPRAAPAGPRVEPNVRSMPEVPPAPGRTEPSMRTQATPPAEVEPGIGRPLTVPEEGPAMGATPELPPAPRVETAPITKPRIRVPAEEVTGRITESPGRIPAATEAAAAPEPTVAPSAGAAVDEGAMAQPVDQALFKVDEPILDSRESESVNLAPKQEPAKPLSEPEGVPPEPGLPPAPAEPVSVKAEEPFEGPKLPTPDKDYVTRVVRSDTRKGGEVGAEQYKRIPQTLNWAGPSAALDRALFDAGAQFKLKSDDPKIAGDAARNHAAAFDRLQTEARKVTQDPALREQYRDLLTADGTQIDRVALQEAATAYRVRVDTMMKDARRANEGRPTALEIPPRSGARAAEAPVTAERQHMLRSPEQVEALNEARTRYDQAVKHAETWKGTDPETAAKMKKGAGMKFAAEKRQITGELTAKEAAAADLRRRTINYKGKPVEVNGKLGTVENVAFGKVKVNFEDGTTARVDPGDVISRAKGGTLSMNPFADPELIKKTIGLISRGNRGMQRALNPVQAMSDDVGPAAAAGYAAAREFYRAREMATWDRIQKTPDQAGIAKDFQDAIAEARAVNPRYTPGQVQTVGDAIRATERARIHTAERNLQRELVEQGYAIVPPRGEPLPEDFIIPQNYGAFTLPDGRILALHKDAAPVLDQMVSGYDWASEQRYNTTGAGRFEAFSHGLTGSLLLLPTFHMVTAGGRILPSAVNLPKNNLMRFSKSASAAMKDRAEMQDMMQHGVTFFSRRGTMEPEGAKAGLIERKMKDMGLGSVYDGYQWLHNEVLADSVNWMQTAYYQWRLDQLKRANPDATPSQLDTYKYMAGRDASLAAANLAKEEGGRSWMRILGSVAFSRGLQVNTIRMASRALEGDRILQAVAQRNGLTVEQAKDVMNKNRKFLTTQLIKDYVLLQVFSNVMNYFTTSAQQEPGGKKGGHFVWENQGSDKGQMLLPTNVFVGTRNVEGKPNGVYMSTPFRSARDIIEYAMIPFELAHGERAAVLRNKASVPVKLGIEHLLTGEDYAGRSLRDPWAAGANLAGSLTPAPFEEVPHYAAEAMRLGNPTYFSEGLKKIFDPVQLGLKSAGMQPKRFKPDPETSMLQGKQIQAEEAIWARASRLKQQLYGMAPAMRDLAVQSVLADAEAAGMDARAKKSLRKMLENQGVSKSATKQAERRLDVAPGLRKQPNIPMLPEAPAGDI